MGFLRDIVVVGSRGRVAALTRASTKLMLFKVSQLLQNTALAEYWWVLESILRSRRRREP